MPFSTRSEATHLARPNPPLLILQNHRIGANECHFSMAIWPYGHKEGVRIFHSLHHLTNHYHTYEGTKPCPLCSSPGTKCYSLVGQREG